MKILHYSNIIIMTTILFSIMSYASQSVFIQGLTYDTELEKQFGSTTKTMLVHDDAILILNQTTQKSAFQYEERKHWVDRFDENKDYEEEKVERSAI